MRHSCTCPGSSTAFTNTAPTRCNTTRRASPTDDTNSAAAIAGGPSAPAAARGGVCGDPPTGNDAARVARGVALCAAAASLGVGAVRSRVCAGVVVYCVSSSTSVVAGLARVGHGERTS